MSEHSTETSSPSRRDDPAPPPIAIRPLDYKGPQRRSMTVVRRWFRDTFNKEQLLSGLRSLVWVAPLTVLIWIYAEREQVNSQLVKIQVEVRSGAPGQVVHLADASEGRVSATIRGPKARVGQAIEALASGTPVQIFIGGGRQPGLSDVEVPTLIERDPRLRDNGLSVVDCEPRILRVTVDTLQEELVDVVLAPDAKRLLNGPAVFDPPKVRVSAPAKAFAAAKGTVVVAQADFPVEMRTPGRHGPTNVRITVPALASSTDLTLRQSNVMLTVDVREADERAVVPSVPVTMDKITQETNDTYKISYTPKFVLSVPVYGSPDRIRQLNSRELPPIEAKFSVTSAEIAAKEGTRKLEYVLPEGITMREEDKKTVTFKVERRDAAQ